MFNAPDGTEYTDDLPTGFYLNKNQATLFEMVLDLGFYDIERVQGKWTIIRPF